MKKLLAILFLLLFLSSSAKAASVSEQKTSSQIGTIDLNAIYALHPMMVYYDENLNLFIKPPKEEPLSKKEFDSLIESRKKEYIKSYEAQSVELKRINEEINSLSRELDTINYRNSTEILLLQNRMKETAGTSDNASIEKSIQPQIDKLNREFNASRQKIELKLTENLAAKNNIIKMLLRNYFLSDEESRQLQKKINDDINEAVGYAAKLKNIQIIININQMPQNLAFTNQNESSSMEQNSLEPQDTNLTVDQIKKIIEFGPDCRKINNLLKTPFKFTRDDPEHQKRKKLDLERRLKEAYSNELQITESLKKYCINDTILSGGADLTPEALKYILNKYKVSSKTVDSLNNKIKAGELQ